MDSNDLMTIKALSENNAMSPYEQYKVGHMQAKSHTSGIGVAGLVLGTVGTAIGVGAWIFAPMYGNQSQSGEGSGTGREGDCQRADCCVAASD